MEKMRPNKLTQIQLNILSTTLCERDFPDVRCLHMNLVCISVSNCRKSPVVIVSGDIGEFVIKLRDINRFYLQIERNVAMGS